MVLAGTGGIGSLARTTAGGTLGCTVAGPRATAADRMALTTASAAGSPGISLPATGRPMGVEGAVRGATLRKGE
jgi:hypothetical protein